MFRLPSSAALRALLLAGGGLVSCALPVAGQGSCQFGPGTGDFFADQIPGFGSVTRVIRPRFVCSDGVRISADSAVAYSAQNMAHLFGAVRYVDGGRELLADEARYFSQQGRLQANGNTVLRDTVQGSEIRNGDMVLLRAGTLRDSDQITATLAADGLRPVARLTMKPAPDTARRSPLLLGLAPADTTRPPEDPAGPVAADTARSPYLVEGDRIFLQGDSYFLATGSVTIDRDSLRAFSDTAEYDQVAERMLLRGQARVVGESYEMVGRTINIALPGGEMGSVRAVREGVLTGEDLRLEAPLIELFLTDGRMERLVAVPLPGDPTTPPRTAADSADLARPVALAQGYRLVGDSVEVQAPGEVLQRLFVAGSARGESSSRDSLNVPSLPEVARHDWLEGDTIIARFAKVELEDLAPGDTITDEYRLEELRAIGSARSLYRMLPADSALRPGVDAPAVHYVTGSAILIVMAAGEVDRMEVEGPTQGWHLEPDRGRQGRDSLRIVPDSAVAPPDTIPPDTVRAAGSASGGRGDGPATPDRRVREPGAALPSATSAERGRARRSGR